MLKKRISLKSLSTNKFIEIKHPLDSNIPLKAEGNWNSESTAFEIIHRIETDGELNEQVISLRSLKNGKMLSTRFKEDLTFVDYLSETEKFCVYFDLQNFVGIYLF